MKQIISVILLLFAVSCTGDRSADPTEALDVAERAFAQGRYARAQSICDTLVMGSTFSSLDVDRLCRLSLLFMRLGENGSDEGVTTALATRCLSAAFLRDSDSTAMAIRAMSPDDRSRAMVLTALNESAQRVSQNDTIVILSDSIPYDEL